VKNKNIENKDIFKRMEKIIKIGNIKEVRIIKDIINYGFEKRKIETRERENRDKLSIKLGLIEYVNDIFLTKETPIERYMENAMINYKIPAEPQYEIGIKRVDFAYPQQRLVIECDGYKWHKQDKEQIEEDINRDKYLARKGWRVLHFSGIQIRRNIEGCINEIKEALFIK